MSNFIIQIPNKVLHFKHNVTVSPPCTLVVNHMHPGYEILYFVSGDATLIIEDKQFYIRPGDLITPASAAAFASSSDVPRSTAVAPGTVIVGAWFT